MYIRKREKNEVHIEVTNGVINITEKLMDRFGREVTSIEVIPDQHKGENKVKRSGICNTRLITLKTINK
jgi:hypothetical protein